jgi:menaquinone-dependent protoporphyrinogen IX oxidase
MPRALLVYYTYTQQSRRIADVIEEALRARGWDVRQASIEFTDKRWSERFTRLPLRHPYGDVVGMLPAQVRGATGDIQLPDDVGEGDYDLVCIGTPTWFFRPSVPVRSFLKSETAGRLLDGKPFAIYAVCRRYWSINLKSVKKLASKQGGEYVDGTHFVFEGGQIRSLLSLLSYFGKGENRERYLGVKIPPSGLKPDFADEARAFANGLADRLEEAAPRRVTSE